jgi:hypothetical protein
MGDYARKTPRKWAVSAKSTKVTTLLKNVVTGVQEASST